MRECKFLATCLFFNDVLEDMPSTAEALKNKYCRESFEKCARYRVRIKIPKVPNDLFPHQSDKVDKIIIDSK